MHGVTSALLVVARMVGMLVGISALTTIGLRRYYAVQVDLPPPSAGVRRRHPVRGVHRPAQGGRARPAADGVPRGRRLRGGRGRARPGHLPDRADPGRPHRRSVAPGRMAHADLQRRLSPPSGSSWPAPRPRPRLAGAGTDAAPGAPGRSPTATSTGTSARRSRRPPPRTGTRPALIRRPGRHPDRRTAVTDPRRLLVAYTHPDNTWLLEGTYRPARGRARPRLGGARGRRPRGGTSFPPVAGRERHGAPARVHQRHP